VPVAVVEAAHAEEAAVVAVDVVAVAEGDELMKKLLLLNSIVAAAMFAPVWAQAPQGEAASPPAKAASAAKAPSAPKASAAAKSYPSPEAAADAFTDALRKYDRTALGVVLGSDWRRYVPPEGGPDKEDVDAYLAGWDKTHKVSTDSNGRAMISVGDPGWTLPIPILQAKSGWHFDLRSGADEIRVRAIGRNELDAMQAALAYVDAQRDFASKDRDKTGVRDYAQKFASSPGKHDGLYWDDTTGQDPSPLGPLFSKNRPTGGGYHGYFFRILTAQGKDAPGGAYDYIVGGRMRNGFGLIAWPVKYGETGVMSFMINHEGKLLEKDLGPQTAKAASTMKTFNPDKEWKAAETQAATK
jgi:hypothetical protein